MLGAAAKGSRGRETRGGGSTREEDVRGTLQGLKPQSTAGYAAPVAAAVLRPVRVEMRPVGGSATEASDGGVGALGGVSGGVAPGGTAKTGVRVASAAGHSHAFEGMCV